MKPRIFIGSSTEGLSIANAVNKALQRAALSKVWSDGVFGLSEASTRSLMREVARADFGIFVFSGDDDATIRGKLLQVPRDNVVYELGLFSGVLGTDRCFFVTVLDAGTHIPTDLLGLTPGTYDATWPEDEMEAAVAPFANDVRRKLKELGFRHKAEHYRLHELIVQFECCEWITDMNRRIEEKERVFAEMTAFCRKTPTNKRTLLDTYRTGGYAAMCAAVVANPEPGDDDILRRAKVDHIKRGVSQHKFMDAIFAVRDAGHLSMPRQEEFVRWCNRWSDPDPTLGGRIAGLRSQ